MHVPPPPVAPDASVVETVVRPVPVAVRPLAPRVNVYAPLGVILVVPQLEPEPPPVPPTLPEGFWPAPPLLVITKEIVPPESVTPLKLMLLLPTGRGEAVSKPQSVEEMATPLLFAHHVAKDIDADTAVFPNRPPPITCC